MRLLALLALAAVSLFGADVTGTWKFEVEIGGNAGSPSFELKQDGEKLSGNYSGLFGKLPVTGSVKSNAIEIVLDVVYEGQKGKVHYTGTIENANKMSGKVEFVGMGSGTWTATK